MTLELGPMPDSVKQIVGQLVAEAQRQPFINRPNAFMLTGGPSYCSYLDADGNVWNVDLWDDSLHLVENGARKVGLIAIAADRVPGLKQWLPRRPTDAVDCAICHASGWLPPPMPHVQCPECFGMGWIT